MKEMDDAIYLKISKAEHDIIKSKMASAGITNESAYLRKMAIDGIIIKLNLSDITELNSLLKRYGNNVNQIAKRVKSSETVYENEIQEIKSQQSEILSVLRAILEKLIKLG